MHRLLARQLRKATRAGQVDLDLLMAQVDEAYRQFDVDSERNARASRVMAQELTDLNRKLRADAELLLRDAIESMSDGFALFDAADRLVIWNRRYVECFPHLEPILAEGITFTDIADFASHFVSPGHDETKRLAWRDWRIDQHRRHVDVFEQRVGPSRYFETTERATSTGGIVLMVRDVSALRQAQIQMREAIEIIDSGFVIYDHRERLLTWNSAFERMYPWLKPLIVAGASYDDLIRANYRAGTGSDALSLDEEAYVRQRRGNRESETPVPVVIKLHGRWFRISDRMMDDGGFVSLHTDITAIKQAEQALRESELEFRSIFNNAPDGIYRADLEGRLLRANPFLLRLFGFADETALDAAVRTGWHLGRDREGRDAFWSCAFRDGRVDAFESEIAVPDRGSIWIAETVRLVRDDSGTPLYFEGSVQEITDRKQTQRMLEHAKEAAEAADRAKSEFLAVMSHEIRTPLNGVIGMIGLLDSGALSAEQQRWIRIARTSADDLLTIVNDILDFSKLEAGRMEIEAIDFRLDETAESIVSLLTPRAIARGNMIYLTIDPDLPRWTRADESRLRQILLNLVGNAIKFTESGRIDLRLWRRTNERTGGLILRGEVADTGIGISEETQARLFTKFSQADGSTTRKYGGTGLGLAISRRLVELMGGAIGVTSRPGEGATFWFELPIEAGTPQTESTAPAAPVQLRPLRILVAEDNHTNQLLIGHLLKAGGHRLDIVGDGAAAVTAHRRAPYDLILMDIQMPEMDGPAATRAIRALPGPEAGVPIIALTANALAGQRERYMDDGMNDCVTKPIDPAKLFAAIAHCIGAQTPNGAATDLPTTTTSAEPTAAAADELAGLLDQLARLESGLDEPAVGGR